jgi:hypothetical protein
MEGGDLQTLNQGWKSNYLEVSNKTGFTKRNIMKSILSYSAVMAVKRCIGVVAVMALAALPAIGAGSAKQAVRKDSDPSITVYNLGVGIDVGKEVPGSRGKI